MSDLFWFLKPPYAFFTAGMVFLFVAVLYTYIGKAWNRYNAWIYRAKEPKRYWSEVGSYYIVGIVLIGVFLFEVYAFPN